MLKRIFKPFCETRYDACVWTAYVLVGVALYFTNTLVKYAHVAPIGLSIALMLPSAKLQIANLLSKLRS